VRWSVEAAIKVAAKVKMVPNQGGESLLVKVKLIYRPAVNIRIKKAHDGRVPGIIRKTTAPMPKKTVPRSNVKPKRRKAF
jgi:hypothetical protein